MLSKHWLIAAAVVNGLLGCGKAPPPAPAPPAAPEVTVATPARTTLHYTVEQPGRIDAFEQTPIYARIAGYVRAVRVEIGDRVKRGDVLAELDVPEMVEERNRKKALVAQAKLGIVQAEQFERVAETSVVSARAAIDVAKASHARAAAALARWESEYQRMERLVKEKVLDQQSRDETLNQVRAAEATKVEVAAKIRAAESALAEAEARQGKAGADRDVARSQLAVAEADERQYAALLGYARITAPFDGVIADRRVHTGHFLPAATGSTKGQPLFVVVRMDKVRVFVEVPETDAVLVRPGNEGRVRVQVLNDREFVGKVSGSSWSLDATQRTLRTEIDLMNPDGLLRPGMYVHALIDIERSGSWLIPAGAVLTRDGVSFCYQVRDGKTHRLPVRLGLRDGQNIEILKVQVPAETAGGAPRWVNPKGDEAIVTRKPGELIDNQEVQVVPSQK